MLLCIFWHVVEARPAMHVRDPLTVAPDPPVVEQVSQPSHVTLAILEDTTQWMNCGAVDEPDEALHVSSSNENNHFAPL